MTSGHGTGANNKSISFSPGFNRVTQSVFEVRTVSTVLGSLDEEKTVETVPGKIRWRAHHPVETG
jgi:hypothetical protein